MMTWLSNVVLQKPKSRADLSLEELIAQAEGFGEVNIFGSTNGSGYCARIKFRTLQGISLEASSEYRLPIKEALIGAIERAEVISGQFK